MSKRGGFGVSYTVMLIRPLISCCLIVAAIAISLVPAHGYLNDHDTALDEKNRLLSVVSVITDRVPHFPPAYYTARVKRLQRSIPRNHAKLDDYDNIAVALDRLGGDYEPLGWMEIKRRVLLRSHSVEGPGPYANQWYTYYSNSGTFQLHRWIRGGAKRDKLTDLQAAQTMLQKALKLNPKAHRGREAYELKLVDWMLREAGNSAKPSPAAGMRSLLSSFSGHSFADSLSPESNTSNDRVRGLTNLVLTSDPVYRLDVLDALAQALRNYATKNPEASAYASMRIVELSRAGEHSYAKSEDDRIVTDAKNALHSADRDALTNFKHLRRDADLLNERRESYALAALRNGSDPDTDESFWSGFKDPGPPKLKEAAWRSVYQGYVSASGIRKTETGFRNMVIGCIVAVAIFACSLWLFVGALRRPHALPTDTEAHATDVAKSEVEDGEDEDSENASGVARLNEPEPAALDPEDELLPLGESKTAAADVAPKESESTTAEKREDQRPIL
ncbi:MAG TPA: hypothetical protein VGK19_18810 [Capsulimonadaceae bacterium]